MRINFNEIKEFLLPGVCHICKKGSEHSIIRVIMIWSCLLLLCNGKLPFWSCRDSSFGHCL